MKAIQAADRGGYDALRLVDIPRPQPRAGQALVRVTSAGVTPLDRTVLAGSHPSVRKASARARRAAPGQAANRRRAVSLTLVSVRGSRGLTPVGARVRAWPGCQPPGAGWGTSHDGRPAGECSRR